MAIVDTVLNSLRQAERELEAQLAGVRSAIASMVGGGGSRGGRRGRRASTRSAAAAGGSRKRRISAEGRARIAAAQRARWAKVRAQKKEK
jgi:hypothetical protein